MRPLNHTMCPHSHGQERFQAGQSAARQPSFNSLTINLLKDVEWGKCSRVSV